MVHTGGISGALYTRYPEEKKKWAPWLWILAYFDWDPTHNMHNLLMLILKRALFRVF